MRKFQTFKTYLEKYFYYLTLKTLPFILMQLRAEHGRKGDHFSGLSLNDDINFQPNIPSVYIGLQKGPANSVSL